MPMQLPRPVSKLSLCYELLTVFKGKEIEINDLCSFSCYLKSMVCFHGRRLSRTDEEEGDETKSLQQTLAADKDSKSRLSETTA
ncbi:hypothetical protein Baya_6986 [Bagarius yarrelli]|uniref:Uncharacterized protein n=1 Tax=Bagarius yarrelli TaxID=175774 RepID=A0A556U3H4_BAGYA|nr:hypothetical protein Baya_6986 [Bagarius yarrelli]